jgi:hypothetical protein
MFLTSTIITIKLLFLLQQQFNNIFKGWSQFWITFGTTDKYFQKKIIRVIWYWNVVILVIANYLNYFGSCQIFVGDFTC